MATLEDSYLSDLDELSENETETVKNDAPKEKEEEIIVNYNDLTKLQKTQRLVDIRKKVEEVLDSDYKLILDCNNLLDEIDKEIVMIHNFIRDNYRLKFPDLELLVTHAIDYAGVVKRIGNETDLALVDLEGLLPTGMILAVQVMAPRKSVKLLSKDVLEKTIDACNRAIDLDSSKKKVQEFLESKTRFIAPNLSSIVGSKIAAKLFVNAGGLLALVNMPPTCNVDQLVGHKRKKTFVGSLEGYLEETEIVRNTPLEHRSDACEFLAAKLTLAARIDFTRGDFSGGKGKAFREEILEEIDDWQEPNRNCAEEGSGESSEDEGYETELFRPWSLGLGSKSFSEFGSFSKRPRMFDWE
ncbi:hypothetical protein AALP_AA3G059100 [Arabis alpina]|uniref:Nop domain-containing protein n=1 Tax=Arabis alpina TaxID=50452 RepID=A0A087H7B2_ARAAL|nr:hypothetical protein AALP_AA3G059100 [Arabis alpina]